MMRVRFPAGLCLAFACACATVGCTRVQVTGELGGEPLQVTGTAVAWLDETAYVQEDDTAAPELVDRSTDDTVLFLRFFEATFDAEADFAALPAGQRQRIADDIAQGDQLLVEIRRGNVLREDDEVKLVNDVGGLPPEILPYLSAVDVRFGAPPLHDSRYPEHAPRLGSDRKALLEVDTLSPDFSGKLTFEVKEADGEADLVTGKVTVFFAVELLPERLAECNFSPGGAGAVDPCTLNARAGALAGAGP